MNTKHCYSDNNIKNDINRFTVVGFQPQEVLFGHSLVP